MICDDKYGYLFFSLFNLCVGFVKLIFYLIIKKIMMLFYLINKNRFKNLE